LRNNNKNTRVIIIVVSRDTHYHWLRAESIVLCYKYSVIVSRRRISSKKNKFCVLFFKKKKKKKIEILFQLSIIKEIVGALKIKGEMKRKRVDSPSITNWLKSSKSQSKCPFCSKLFSEESIENHVNIHLLLSDSKRKIEPNASSSQISSRFVSSNDENDAFSILLQSSQTKAPKKVEFCLYLTSSGKYLPSIQFTGETGDVPSHSTLWSSKVRIKGVQCGSSSSEKRELCVELKTNILPSTSSSKMPTKLTSKDTQSGSSSSFTSPAIIKSMLQKAIRRKNSSAAARLALELYRISPSELLRRLPVIIIEDSSLHPAYPLLVWCLLAESKGYVLPNCLLIVILRVAFEIAYVDIRDVNSYMLSDDNPEPAASSADSSNTTAVTTEADENTVGIETMALGAGRSLVVSIILRAALGGMSGDVKMLKSAAVLWKSRIFRKYDYDDNSYGVSPPGIIPHNEVEKSICHSYLDESYLNSLSSHGLWGTRLLERFKQSEWETKLSHEYSEYLTLEKWIRGPAPDSFRDISVCMKLRQSDFLPEGIDFHCDWKMLPALLDKVWGGPESTLDEEQIKSLIWMFRSSINNHRVDDIEDDRGSYKSSCQVQLAKKSAKAGDWKILCSHVTEYCKNKSYWLWKNYVKSYQ